MATIPTRLPAALSERLASATSALYSRQGREFDVALGGIPFRLATFTDAPQTVETIPIRKDQFDTENDPGEQTLSGWWRRSQASWHEGAGNLYQENSERTVDSASFFDSSGVDVFTPGKLTLLKKMVQTQASSLVASHVRTYAANSVRTNLCTNPGMEVSTAGWVVTDGGNAPDLPTFTRDTSKSHTGSASGHLVWATDDATGFPPSLTAPAATIGANAAFTAQARVWVPTGSPAVVLIGNGIFGTSTGALKDQWVNLTLHTTADAGGVPQVAFWPETPASAGKEFWVDSVIVEEGSVAGSFFTGAFVDCAWTGAANLSTSIETIVAAAASASVVAGGDLYTAATIGSTYSVLHNPATTIVDGLVSGGNFYDIASDGTLYEGLVSSPGTATTWPCGTTPTRLGWGKHRLWIIGGRKLWQPDLSLAGGTTQNPKFTHPNKGWTYTCMAEGASAMLFGGHDGFASTIQSIVLDSGGALPTLSGAAVTAALPDGELVQELSVLAGQFVGIGTSRGFRVGTIASNGQITYGPLLIEPEGVQACTALTAQGRFFVVAFRVAGGSAIAYRVDTGTELSPLIFPYAKDIDCGFTASITSLSAPTTDQLICTTSDGAAWHQSLTTFVDTGYLQTGRIRFRTTEFKQFKNIIVELEPLAGSVVVDLIKEGGSTLPIGSVTVQGEVFSDRFAISSEKMRYASVKLTLTPNGGKTAAPVVNSYQLRAIPAISPQRLITLPLLCFDKEQSRSGQTYGGQNFANDRLTALQLLEDTAETLLFQDFTSLGGDGQSVTIEGIRFIATAPAPPYKEGGAGGVLVLQLRTAEA